MGRLDATEEELTYHVVDDRRAIRSAWGRGNPKIGTGPGIYTYSRLPGRAGTCPGATDYCEEVCYSKRFKGNRPLWDWMAENMRRGTDLPPLPVDTRIVRIHVSGDFDTVWYIEAWARLCKGRSDVRFFGYTRSWRIPRLLPPLEELRSLPNVQLFASMDEGTAELPPRGWRRAWLTGVIGDYSGMVVPFHTADGVPVLLCPEEVGRRANCEACQYCISGRRGDVLFPIHGVG